MPIYEYHCDDCGKDFECIVFGSETPECKHCDGKNIKRMMSACGFLSKGAGGETVSTSAGASSCGSCSATSCGSCGH
ncbi:zinc ribbon domain-containing protein [Desulfobacterales bacterium HSG17]|nr:zinc ribbon domain-containing protein [Desulfobacterales bacterium HSG17]